MPTPSSDRCYALVPCAGVGARAGTEGPKQRSAGGFGIGVGGRVRQSGKRRSVTAPPRSAAYNRRVAPRRSFAGALPYWCAARSPRLHADSRHRSRQAPDAAAPRRVGRRPAARPPRRGRARRRPAGRHRHRRAGRHAAAGERAGVLRAAVAHRRLPGLGDAALRHLLAAPRPDLRAPGDRATSVAAIRGTRSNAASVRATIAVPATGAYCFGPSVPARAPTPAHGTRA